MKLAATPVTAAAAGVFSSVAWPMLQARFGGSGEAVLKLFLDRGYRMFALDGGRLEERTTLVEDLPWKDYFFIHPSRAARLPDGVFKARMSA